MDSPYARELRVAFTTLQQAAGLTRAVTALADKGVLSKDDLSPVTVADFAVQALLVAALRHAFPADRFMGEESAAELRRNGKLLDRVWELLLTVRQARDPRATGAAAAVGALSEENGEEDEEEEEEEEEEEDFPLPASREDMCRLIDLAGETTDSRAGRVWVLDPIDGTKTYVRGELYAINCALLRDGEQAVGVVACPNLDRDPPPGSPVTNATVDPAGPGCIFFAVRGHGAYMRPLPGPHRAGDVRRLERYGDGEGEAPLRFADRVSLPDKVNNQNAGEVVGRVARELGAEHPACDLVPHVMYYVVLAMGWANTWVKIYRDPRRTGKTWDHAGAMLLFQEVGGKVTDLNGCDMDFSVGRSMRANLGGQVAAASATHDTVLKVVRKVLLQEGMESHLQQQG